MSSSQQRAVLCGYPGVMVREAGTEGLWVRQAFQADAIEVDPGAAGLSPSYGPAWIKIKASFQNTGADVNQLAISARLVTEEDGALRTHRFGDLSDLLEAYAPEFLPLVAFKEFSVTGRPNLVANTVYLAGDRDFDGLSAGEPAEYQLWLSVDRGTAKAYDTDFLVWVHQQLQTVRERGPGPVEEAFAVEARRAAVMGGAQGFSLAGFECAGEDCPFADAGEARAFAALLCEEARRIEQFDQAAESRLSFQRSVLRHSNGKQRDLAGARREACWPEATDEELMAPPEVLEQRLLDRLPGLIDEFREIVERAGFQWEAPAPSLVNERDLGQTGPRI